MIDLPIHKKIITKVMRLANSKNIKYLKYFTIFLIMAPLGIWALLISHYGVNVPYWDEWEIVRLLKNLSENNLSISDLFVQHNEHRLFFPNLVMLAVSELSHLNICWFMYCSFILMTLILLILYLMYRSHFKNIPLPLLWFVPVSWFVFNIDQTEGMLWGYELQIFLCIFGFFIALYCLDKCVDLDKWMIFAIFGGILSTFSFFNGLLVWPIGFIFICLSKTQKFKLLIIWLLSATVSYGIFFYNWSHPSYHPSIFYLFQSPVSSVEYFIINIGCPLLRSNTIMTFFLGVIVIFCIAPLLYYVVEKKLCRENALFLAILLFSLGSSFILMVGRSGLGVGQSTASRYLSFTLIGIIALYFISLNLIFKDNTHSNFISVEFILVGLLLIGGIINGFIIGLPDAESNHNIQLSNQYKLINYQNIPVDNLKTLNPDPLTTYNLSKFLDSEKLSVFVSEYPKLDGSTLSSPPAPHEYTVYEYWTVKFKWINSINFTAGGTAH